MSTSQSPSTRERPLQAAASLIWEHGYQATGVDELCACAEAKKGSFYHYFPSKVDLAIAAIEQTWQQVEHNVFQPVFSSASSGMAQLDLLVAKVSEYLLVNTGERKVILGCPFGNLGQEMALQDEGIRLVLQRIFEAHCAYIESALNRAQAAGEIPAGNNKQRAKNIFALLEGSLLMAKVGKDLDAFKHTMPVVRLMVSA